VSQPNRPVVTLLLHCCHTVVTLLLHCCYTVAIITLLSHCCCIVVTLLSHCCYTVDMLIARAHGVSQPNHPVVFGNKGNKVLESDCSILESSSSGVKGLLSWCWRVTVLVFESHGCDGENGTGVTE
jgi:hypothetical protein